MRRLLIIGIIVLLAISSFVGCVEKKDDQTQITEYAVISLGEIYYKTSSNDVDGEFIELYVWDDKGESVDISGWYVTTFDDDKEILPSISGLGNYDYVAIRMGSGVDDLDASDGDATIFLGRSDEMLDDSGDEIGLYNPSNVLVDFVRYEGGNGDPVLGNWSDTDLGASADNENESVQLIGFDNDNSNNWKSSPISQASPNIVDFFVDSYNLEVYIHNGVKETYTFEDTLIIGPTNVTVNPTHPVDNATVFKFVEFVNFSLDLYKKCNFNDPETGGDDKIDITLSNATHAGETRSTGGTSLNGDITIFVGFNDVTDKRAMEHELIHAIHNKKTQDAAGNNYTRRSVERFKNEGFAEYFGIKSTLLNLNISEEEFLENTSSVQGYGLDDFLSNPDINIFGDWQSTWGHYAAAYLYIKYIASKYGEEKLLKIYNSQRNYNDPLVKDPNDITGTDAINKAFSEQPEHKTITFNDTFVNWTAWLWENYSKYIVLSYNESFNGTKNLSEDGRLTPYGIDFERVKIDTENGTNLGFNGANNTNYSVTIIKKKNGVVIGKETYRFSKSQDIEIAGGPDEIIIIKAQIGGTGNTVYNFTVKERIKPLIFPSPSIKATPTTGYASLRVDFEGSATDDGTIVQYHWAFGDGETSEEQNPWHVYTSPGTYSALLVVMDNDGALNSTSVTITVKERPRFSVASIQGHVHDGLYVDKIGIQVEHFEGADDTSLASTVVDLSSSMIDVSLNYDSNNYCDYCFVTNNIFNQSAFNLSNEEFGLIIYADEDGSCTQDNPIMNAGDVVYITVNTTICFEGIFTSTTITGFIEPETGASTEISFTTPGAYDEEIIELV